MHVRNALVSAPDGPVLAGIHAYGIFTPFGSLLHPFAVEVGGFAGCAGRAAAGFEGELAPGTGGRGFDLHFGFGMLCA